MSNFNTASQVAASVATGSCGLWGGLCLKMAPPYLTVDQNQTYTGNHWQLLGNVWECPRFLDKSWQNSTSFCNILQPSTLDCPLCAFFVRPWRFWWDFVAGPEHCLARPRHSANQRCPRWIFGAASWPDDASSWTLRSENSSAYRFGCHDEGMCMTRFRKKNSVHLETQNPSTGISLLLQPSRGELMQAPNSHAKAAKEPCSLPTWCCSWWCLEATLLPSYSPGIFRPGGLNWACPPSYINHHKAMIHQTDTRTEDIEPPGKFTSHPPSCLVT